MGLSRWGARADAKLNEPVPEKTFSETITDIILQSEYEDTIKLLFEALANRLVSHFPLDSLEIAYDPACAWYVVKARRSFDDGGPFSKDAVVVVNIKDEDITRNAQSKGRWKDFMDVQARRMMRELRMQTSEDLPAMVVDMKTAAEALSSAMQRMAVSVNDVGIAWGRVEKLKEDEAIESIKRTIAERAER